MNSRRVIPAALLAAVIGATFTVGSLNDDPEPDVDEQAQLVTDEMFCDGFRRLATAQRDHLEDASSASTADLKDAAREFASLVDGTAMPDDARSAAVFIVTAFLSLEDDATAQDLVEADDAASLTDDRNADALIVWLGNTCGSRGLSQAK